ncbi:hypothetical protein OH77DRAFT_324300 [Trametes cingulata]|nr:hypothetical protein OH77DRAFT_324300 [Trametes cingulata]
MGARKRPPKRRPRGRRGRVRVERRGGRAKGGRTIRAALCMRFDRAHADVTRPAEPVTRGQSGGVASTEEAGAGQHRHGGIRDKRTVYGAARASPPHLQ